MPAIETEALAGSAEDIYLRSVERILPQLIYHIDELQFANGALNVCIQAVRQQTRLILFQLVLAE